MRPILKELQSITVTDFTFIQKKKVFSFSLLIHPLVLFFILFLFFCLKNSFLFLFFRGQVYYQKKMAFWNTAVV
jgi:hypothetical protein